MPPSLLDQCPGTDIEIGVGECCGATATAMDVEWNGTDKERLREWMREPTLPTLLRESFFKAKGLPA